MNSSTVAPSLRLLKRAVTGTLVPLNTHAPLTLPGLLSMAMHVLQSFMVVTCLGEVRWGLFYTDYVWLDWVVPVLFLNVNTPRDDEAEAWPGSITSAEQTAGVAGGAGGPSCRRRWSWTRCDWRRCRRRPPGSSYTSLKRAGDACDVLSGSAAADSLP